MISYMQTITYDWTDFLVASLSAIAFNELDNDTIIGTDFPEQNKYPPLVD